MFHSGQSKLATMPAAGAAAASAGPAAPAAGAAKAEEPKAGKFISVTWFSLSYYWINLLNCLF